MGHAVYLSKRKENEADWACGRVRYIETSSNYIHRYQSIVYISNVLCIHFLIKFIGSPAQAMLP